MAKKETKYVAGTDHCELHLFNSKDELEQFLYDQTIDDIWQPEEFYVYELGKELNVKQSVKFTFEEAKS